MAIHHLVVDYPQGSLVMPSFDIFLVVRPNYWTNSQITSDLTRYGIDVTSL